MHQLLWFEVLLVNVQEIGLNIGKNIVYYHLFSLCVDMKLGYKQKS